MLAVERLGDLAGIARNQACGVGVGTVDQELHRGRHAASHIASKISGDNQGRASFIGGKSIFGAAVVGPRDHVKGDRSAKRVDVLLGRRSVIEVLHHDRQVGDSQRDGRPQEQQKNERKRERESESAIVADDLRQFLASLGEDAAHCAPLFVGRDQPLLARFLDHTDEYVLKRKAPLLHVQHANALGAQFFGGLLLSLLYVVIGDDVQAFAE